MHFRRAAIVLVTTTVLLSRIMGSAIAQPLADRVPGDALLYAGWAGADTPNTGYAGSHLEAVVAEVSFRAAFDQLLPQLLAKANVTPQDKQNIDTALAIAGPFWRHPSAFYVEPSGDEAVNSNPFRGGLICQAGAEAKSLAGQLTDALAKDAEAAQTLQVVESDDLVAIVFGYGAAPQFPAAGAANALAKAQSFSAAMKQTVASPVVSVYLDLDRFATLIEQRIATEENARQIWLKVRDAAGFDGLHRIAVGARFEGKGFASASFVDAPAPRKGLVALFEGRPVDADVLKSIPRNAGSAQIARFDFAALVHEIRRVVAAADEGAAQKFDQGLGAVQMMIGRNLLSDILEPLGDTWMMFSDDSIAGNSTQGIVIVNKLDDPAKASQGLAALWIAAMNAANPQMLRAGSQARFAQSKVGDLAVYTLQTPTISPGLTINNGRLVIGFSADAAVKAATTAAPAADQGFDRNEKYATLVKQLSPGAPITSFRFADLPQTAPTMYREYEAGIAQLREYAQQQGIQLPEKILPSLQVIQANLAPSGEVSWTDAAGFHSRAISPFPGSDALSNAPNNSTMTQAGVSAMLVSVMLPSLARARETANRVKCASNMHEIAKAMFLYSNEHNGQYPPDLATLAREPDMRAERFVCPGAKKVPADVNELPPGEMLAQWVAQNSDYIYLGADKNNASPAEDVLMYENPANHGRDGVNVMFGDGHIEFLLTREAQRKIPNFKPLAK